LNLIGQKIWLIARPLIFGAIIFYIFILLYFTISQSRFIYFPHREITATPADIGLQYEAVSLKTEDGLNLSAWFIPAKEPRAVLLFCHGNAGNISHRLESLHLFYRLGLSTFIFDYRGYGQSEGKPTEQGTYLDVETAWNYLVREKEVAPTEVIIFGRSVGGAIAARLARDHPPQALIVESTFTSVQNFAGELYPFLPVKLISRFNYDALGYLPQVNCPVLIIHSRDDEMIPFNHGQHLFQVANEPKEFLEIRGSHNEGFVISAEHYQEGLNSFISRHTGK
jgi:fermentation-respiration switch protein FrsA (DUF1100 family)